ncbi:MAG: VCBS domain-containing protein, partial [Burkholderiales bacterium]|nr:VCBS domain-containing protein [Burkholderiales bacterium]
MATIIGDDTDNILNGTKKGDVIVGGAGNDTLSGGGGNDTLYGGAGNDELYGQAGNDTLFGGAGNDMLFGGTGNDALSGEAGDDSLFGGRGSDQLDGGAGDDILYGDSDGVGSHGGVGSGGSRGAGSGGHGSAGGDYLNGGAGNDKVYTQAGDDTGVYSWTENLLLPPAHGKTTSTDLYDGGKGFDTLELHLTYGERAAAAAELTAFDKFLADNANPKGDGGPAFKFSSFDLTVSDWEQYNVVLENSGPVAGDDSATTDGDRAALLGNVLTNDSDVDHLDVLHVAAVNGVAGQVAMSVPGDNGGTFVINADGSYTFNPRSAFQHLAVGETAISKVSYTVMDLAGATDTATLTITITGSNDAATVSSSATPLTEGDAAAALNASGMLAITDPDSGEAHVVAQTHVQGAYGDFSINANGAWTYTGNGAHDELTAGQQVQDSFTVASQDGTASGTVTIDITGTNDAPVITAEDLTGGVTEPAGGASTPAPQTALAASYLTAGNVLVNGLGGASGFGESTLGRADDESTGAINLTSLFGATGINFFGNSYTSLFLNNTGNITFNSAFGNFSPSSIAAGVGRPIIAPFWGDVDTRASSAGTTLGGNSTGSNLLWYDLDSVNGVFTATWDDVGHFPQGQKANAFQVQLINEGNGDFDIVLRYEAINWTAGTSNGLGGRTARAGYNAQDAVHYFELPQSGNETQMLALPTLPGNTGIAGVDVFSVRSGQVGAGDLTDSGTIQFADVDLADAHLVSALGTPVGNVLGTLTAVLDHDTTGSGMGGQLTWTYSVASSATNYLAAGETRVESFTIALDDQHGGLVTRQIDVTITGTNDAPIVSATDVSGAVTEQVTPTGNLTDTGTISFTDVDLTDIHSLSAVTPGAGALGSLTASVNTDTTGTGLGGVVRWNYSVADAAVEYLANGQTKLETFSFNVQDGNGGTASRTVSVTITGTNDAPVISVVTTDSDAKTLNETNAALSSSGTLTVVDADLSDTVAASVVSVVASDTTTGLGSNDAALAAMLTLTPGPIDADAGDTHNLSWLFNSGNEAFDYLAAGEHLTLTYTVRATDSSAPLASDDQTLTITVTGTNDAPVVEAGDVTGGVTELVDGVVSRYANSVIAFSSQYSTSDWSADQLLGPPDTIKYGDIETAWAPLPRNGTQEFVAVGFATPVYANQVVVRETWGNGFVRQVDLLDVNNVLHTVWTGSDPSLPGSPVNFTIDFASTDYLVQGV